MTQFLNRLFPSARRTRRACAPRSTRAVPRLTEFEQRETPAVGFLTAGAAAGAAPFVTVLRSDGSLLARVQAFDLGFRGGVHTALAELPGNPGTVELVAAAGPGGGPHVKVFAINTATGVVTQVASFMAFDPSFRGGVNVAAADFNGDGIPDIVTGAGPGGGPHVEVFDGRSLQVMRSFMAFDPGFRGGVSVAAGELDGVPADGPEMALAAGPGGGPHVRILLANGTQFASFFAFSPAFTGGVTLGQAGQGQFVAGAGSTGAINEFTFGPGSTLTLTPLAPGTIVGALTNTVAFSPAAVGGVVTNNAALLGFPSATFTANGTLIAPAGSVTQVGVVTNGLFGPVVASATPAGTVSLGTATGMTTTAPTGLTTTTGGGGAIPSGVGTVAPLPEIGLGTTLGSGLGAFGATALPTGGTGFLPTVVGTADQPIGQLF
jgi:hypothetical protein